MGIMPVKKLIVTMSLPMMVSMLVQALYNVVDSMFVAQLSEDALTAVTLAFPMQNLLISFASGTGVGINALLSKALGEKRFDRADEAACSGLFLGFVTYLLFLLIGTILTCIAQSAEKSWERLGSPRSLTTFITSGREA